VDVESSQKSVENTLVDVESSQKSVENTLADVKSSQKSVENIIVDVDPSQQSVGIVENAYAKVPIEKPKIFFSLLSLFRSGLPSHPSAPLLL